MSDKSQRSHQEDPTKSVATNWFDRRADRPPQLEDFCLLVSTALGVHVARLPAAGRAVFGRAAEATIVVDDASVSRQHAEIVLAGDRLVLIDLGSRNGTRVDGLVAKPNVEVPLRIGSVVELGSTTLVLQRAVGFANLGATMLPATPRVGDAPVVRDPTMARLYGLLDIIAPSPLSILILGETGVGKEVFAEEAHRRSLRARGPFLKLNCAAIPESLLEGELFGYERGAFTGAAQAKAGLFEAGEGGTVFLDEIGEVPASTQAKLLRVLESGEVLRLGSVKPRVVDVRFVSATNRDLRALMADGRFRLDLYFRLNGASLTLPPLRKRVLDIAPLVETFVARLSQRLKTPRPRITEQAMKALEAYDWPGNVRELKNVVERAVVMARLGDVKPEHLMLTDMGDGLPAAPPAVPGSGGYEAVVEPPTSIHPPRAHPSSATLPPAADSPLAVGMAGDASRSALKAKLDEMDRQAIVDALEATAGNQSAAAKLLGITRRMLVYRIELYGIARPRKNR